MQKGYICSRSMAAQNKENRSQPMGLSSSQARLLNLTARMHQIEYKAARLEAMKLQMANESRQVYETYLDALDKTKVQVKVINTDGSVTYRDMHSYSDFTSAGFALDFKGVVYDGSKCYALKDDASSCVDKTAIDVTAADVTAKKYPGVTAAGTYYKAINAETYYPADKVDTSEEVSLDFARLCKVAFGATSEPTAQDFETVITNLINSGDVTIVQKDKKNNIFQQESNPFFADFETSVATNTGLREETDEIALKKAEAQYEADMKKIDLKDRKYDTDLAALETERNAIKQEMETLKTVAKDNVERTFKLFS